MLNRRRVTLHQTADGTSNRGVLLQLGQMPVAEGYNHVEVGPRRTASDQDWDGRETPTDSVTG